MNKVLEMSRNAALLLALLATPLGCSGKTQVDLGDDQGTARGGGGSSAGKSGTDEPKGTAGEITGVVVQAPPTPGSCQSTSIPAAPEPPAAGAEKKPCDIYASDGSPCVAAHSTVRALYAQYRGPLYRLQKSDGSVKDVGLLAPGGLVDSAIQDAFCGTSGCSISMVYDQSGQGNHLTRAPAGGGKPTPGDEAVADAAPASFGGHRVYGVGVVPGVGYRNNDACGTASGDDAETVYMVVERDAQSAGCCFEYGNMERDSFDRGDGAVEAVYYGSNTIWGKGTGNGPWVMGDLENGLWPGDMTPNDSNQAIADDVRYLTAMLKGDAAGKNHWSLKSGDARQPELVTLFDGARPGGRRYNPMRKQGGIGMGTAGDNSSNGTGTFFEGVMTTGYTSAEADAAVQASISSVYGHAD